MKGRHWLAIGSFSAAVLIGLSALLSPSAQFAADYGADGQGSSKGKGPGKCHIKIFCDPQQCQQVVCSSNDRLCECSCQPIAGCVPSS